MLALLFSIWLAAKVKPIDVRVSPNVCLVPCKVVVSVIIPPQEDNRWAIVQVDGPEFRSSRIELHGEATPRVTEVPYTFYEDGEFEVLAVLYTTRGEISRARTTLITKGPE